MQWLQFTASGVRDALSLECIDSRPWVLKYLWVYMDPLTLKYLWFYFCTSVRPR